MQQQTINQSAFAVVSLLLLALLLQLGCEPTAFESRKIVGETAMNVDGKEGEPDIAKMVAPAKGKPLYKNTVQGIIPVFEHAAWVPSQGVDPNTGQEERPEPQNDGIERLPWEPRPPEPSWQENPIADGSASGSSGPAPGRTPSSPKALADGETAAYRPDAMKYRIRTGDIISISIPYEVNSVRTVPVQPDGRVRYLFDIEVAAAGLTYDQLRGVLVSRLKRYYKEPELTVIGKSFAGNSVFIMGPVKKPGAHTIQNDTRLLDVLANAGVLSLLPQLPTEDSDISQVREVIDLDRAYLARGDEVLPINFRELLLKRKLEQNILLEPRDFIFFPSTYGTDNKIYICGRVQNPKVYRYTGSLTFLEAVLEAGGTDTDVNEGQDRGSGGAQNRRCYIVRGSSKTPIEVDYAAIQMGKKPDVYLESGDIVYVPERSLHYASRVATNVIHEILAPMQAILDASDMAQKYYRRKWQLPARDKARLK